jgi:hypothetical protein
MKALFGDFSLVIWLTMSFVSTAHSVTAHSTTMNSTPMNVISMDSHQRPILSKVDNIENPTDAGAIFWGCKFLFRLMRAQQM